MKFHEAWEHMLKGTMCRVKDALFEIRHRKLYIKTKEWEPCQLYLCDLFRSEWELAHTNNYIECQMITNNDQCYVYMPNGDHVTLSYAANHARFIGFVFERDGRKILSTSPTLYADGQALLVYNDASDNLVVLRPVAVRFRRET